MAGLSKHESAHDSDVAKAGKDAPQAKLDSEVAGVWTKEGSADIALPRLKDMVVETLPFESRPPELFDDQTPRVKDDLRLGTGFEVVPYKETATVQEFVGDKNVTDIIFPKQADGKEGGKRQIHRDKDGNVDQINEPDGSVYIKENGKWKHISKNGQVEDIKDVSAKSDGTVKITRPDGSAREEYPDGHSVERDLFGRVTEVDYLNKSPNDLPPKGHGDGKRHYHYGVDGQIDEYTAPNGSHWKKDGDHWQKVDENGKPIVDKNDPENKHNIMYGDMSVDSEGNLLVKNHHMKGEEPHNTRIGADGWRDNPSDLELGERALNASDRSMVKGSDKSPPSEGFVDKVEQGIADLPPNVQEFMRKHQIKVKVVNSIEAEYPELANQPGRGHAGEMYKNLDGFYDPKTNTVVIAEHFRDPRTNEWKQDPIRIGAVIVHETGHAIDYNYPGGKFSQSEAFRKAYMEELKGLSEQDKKRLAYFLQKSGAGPEEALGDIFAAIYYGRPAFTNSEGLIELFKTKFAHSMAVAEAAMDKLG